MITASGVLYYHTLKSVDFVKYILAVHSILIGTKPLDGIGINIACTTLGYMYQMMPFKRTPTWSAQTISNKDNEQVLV